ncbi:hypothetical protein GYA49_01245 [Candidatus Beckwithbacteria bacterium]|nr:hypothetical protein [Candidatus Beckwithbacteria bacterium]
MIAKTQWFQRRKYGGWGVSPKTWQAWVYMAAVTVPFVVFQSLPVWSDQIRLIGTILWLLFLLIDLIPVMIKVSASDERENKIEALAERNAAWIMMGALIIGILYQLIVSSLQQAPQVDWFLVIALTAGVLAKSISNLVLKDKNL